MGDNPNRDAFAELPVGHGDKGHRHHQGGQQGDWAVGLCRRGHVRGEQVQRDGTRGPAFVKGDETGMLRFGGSSYSLSCASMALPDVQNEESWAVRSELATCRALTCDVAA